MSFACPVRNPGFLHHITRWGLFNGPRSLLVFSYGLFTIAAQSLLFREFLTTFEGNDISVGIFFGCWFLWVSIAALFVYKAHGFADKLLKNAELFFLLYLPAFVLEFALIVLARRLAGVESYTLLSIPTILLLSIIVTAPVSSLTGMLFPVACRWLQQDEEFAVSRVYILEAAGSFVGGLLVTLLLVYGVSSVTIFFILAFVLSCSVFIVKVNAAILCGEAALKRHAAVRAAVVSLVPLFAAVCLFFGADKALMHYVRVVKWTGLLPREALAGSFQTAQAEYLYGHYRGQWMAVREGGVVETLPDEAEAGRIVALTLCQNPKAKRILVIGSGLGLCQQFLRLPQTEKVTWGHCDSQYLMKVSKFIPAGLRIIDGRLDYIADDVRSVLTGIKEDNDIVIINLPDVTSSVLNRYYTYEFYRRVKQSLRPGGILAVRIAGGANIMGTELVSLGASTKLTLEKVFSQIVLVPGEDTWFIASDSAGLTGEPASLRDRFSQIDGAGDIYPPDGLLSIYLPERASVALEAYSRAGLPPDLLINRDWRPLTHLYSLLLAAKQSGAPVTRLVKNLALAGPMAFVIPVVVFMVLRVLFILKTPRRDNYSDTRALGAELTAASGFDSTFLVFSAGWVAIGIMITLMFLYQTRFGSLYLHIGIISSVFMVGLTAGAMLTRYLLTTTGRVRSSPQALLFKVFFAHTLILAAVAFYGIEVWNHLNFAAAFLFCGLCAGCYFPLAARQLADAGFDPGAAGAKLENADHLGAAAGGFMTGLVFVPVLGTRWTAFVLILLVLANVPAVVLRFLKPLRFCPLSKAAFRFRRAGYILFGIGLSVVLASSLLARAGEKLRPSLPRYTAQALAGQSNIEQASAVVQDRAVDYFKVHDTEGQLIGYVFSSQDLAPDVRGFGGRMNLAVYVDTAGEFIDLHIVQSNETPAYLRLIEKWRQSLKGRRLFEPGPFTDIRAVTGATVSSQAILSALGVSGKVFAGQVLGLAAEGGTEGKHRLAYFVADRHGIYLFSGFVLTLLVIYRGGFWSRLAVLLFNLIAGGIVLNAQYSTEQMATVLSLHAPAIGLTGAFLLVVGVPLLVIIFGNIYCGYICPFGAAQELLGYIIPSRFKPSLTTEKMRKAGFVRYIVLFVFVLVFFGSRNRTTLSADPLISIFSLGPPISPFQSSMLLIMAAVLLGSVFYTRFWCLYLCPAGAFLSLFNNIALLKRLLPARRFDRCEFHVTAEDHTECIYCDRCRYQPKSVTEKPDRARTAAIPGRCFLIGVILIALFISAVSVDRFLLVSATGFTEPAVSALSGGQPRDVDAQRIETMIRQGGLSDKEAQFYKKIE